MDLIASGYLSSENPGLFAPLHDSLVNHDEYLLMADFEDYVECQDRVATAYRDQDNWTQDVGDERGGYG
jgi:starch phosphorylase